MARRSQLVSLFRCIRWADVLILQGPPILGLVFSIGSITATKLLVASIFVTASFLLVAHVFTLNDWADYTRRFHHSNRAMLKLEGENITPQRLFVFSCTLLAASLLIFLFLPGRCLLLAIAVAALGISYSHPSLNAKSIPIVSTLLHLIGGLLYFLLGYALFSPIDGRGVLIGLFFGLAFAAGHPVQEVRDVGEDRNVGAITNAIVFGRIPTFLAGLILFTTEYLYLLWLAWSGLLPRFIFVLPIVCFPIHIWWGVQTLRRGVTCENIVRFEKRYRILYAMIGLALLLSIVG